MRVGGDVPNVINQLRALLAELIGPVRQDLAVGGQDAMDTDDGPIEDAAPLTTGALKSWHVLIFLKQTMCCEFVAAPAGAAQLSFKCKGTGKALGKLVNRIRTSSAIRLVDRSLHKVRRMARSRSCSDRFCQQGRGRLLISGILAKLAVFAPVSQSAWGPRAARWSLGVGTNQ
jgi:hypothetical protein